MGNICICNDLKQVPQGATEVGEITKKEVKDRKKRMKKNLKRQKIDESFEEALQQTELKVKLSDDLYNEMMLEATNTEAQIENETQKSISIEYVDRTSVSVKKEIHPQNIRGLRQIKNI